jgi:hypothetical protein
VTQSATWTIGDTGVLRLVAPGVFSAAAGGDTFIRATWQGIDSAMISVSVFRSTPPVQTIEIDGVVYPAGLTRTTGAIDVRVEIVDGPAAGRSATTGVPSPLLPGYLLSNVSSGSYRLYGVPFGTFTLRATKDGYVTQQRQVSMPADALAFDFQLQPK